MNAKRVLKEAPILSKREREKSRWWVSELVVENLYAQKPKWIHIAHTTIDDPNWSALKAQFHFGKERIKCNYGWKTTKFRRDKKNEQREKNKMKMQSNTLAASCKTTNT